MQEIVDREVRAARGIDDRRAFRERIEYALAENAARGVSERQQAHQDVGAREESRQGVQARVAIHARQLAGRAAPAGAVEAEAAELFGDRLPQHSQSQDADAARPRRADRKRLPAMLALLREIRRPMAMHREHGERGVLHHAVDEARLDHAHHRDRIGHLGEIELVDARADAEEHFEIGEGGAQVGRQGPRREVSHDGRIAHVGPDAKRHIRRMGREVPRP